MKDRKLRSHEVMLRMARVRELRASMALSKAHKDEREQKAVVNEVTVTRDAVTAASVACLSRDLPVNMGRYATLAVLEDALAVKWRLASDELISLSKAREASANQSLMAKRYRDHVSTCTDETRRVLEQARSARQLDDGIEVWLGNKVVA
ncbi:hypothetical protein [Dyella tabacisoli]|uniref:Uncharacterized protein n=1 Tax=Dyella tabacisoli TaxID=2282381 RepID=A0A369USW1_9GAMM|nr:hypothetical protein [Dyella tabacisoli]RDD81429.1 hypothetical protein DVJ77_12000 [Dyella tabacisoli]